MHTCHRLINNHNRHSFMQSIKIEIRVCTYLACVPVIGPDGSKPSFSYKQTWQYFRMLVQEMVV